MKFHNSLYLFIAIWSCHVITNAWSQVMGKTKSKNKPVCGPNPTNLTKEELPTSFSFCDQVTKKSISQRHPDQSKNTGDILRKYEYRYTEYNVTTMDGYILQVFRIVGAPKVKGKKRRRRQPVYVQHGLGGSSDSWLLQPGIRNLPFKLADAGHDVWLANSRGTSYSLGHKRYNHSKDLQYWNFSWHEMGMYDLTAITDMILSETKKKKIFFVGHSTGTTQYFVALSEIPNMNKKIIAAFLLAPMAYIGHCSNGLRLAFPMLNNDAEYQTVSIALQGRIQSDQAFRLQLKLATEDLCAITATKCGVCDNLMFMLFGYNAPQMNSSELPNILAKLPNTISVKTLAHISQSGSTCSFRKYDYGSVGNSKIYKSLVPPDYKLSNIKAPTFFYYGEGDNLCAKNDVHVTASKFKRGVVKGIHKVNDKFFTHNDFVVATDADKLVYNQILKEMKKYK